MSLRTIVDDISINIETIKPSEVPQVVSDHMLYQSGLYTTKPLLDIYGFDTVSVVDHANGATSFIARHDKAYANETAGSERLWYVVDSSPSAEIIGTGEIRLSLNNDDLSDMPFIGSLYTKPQHRGLRRGNLIERLLVIKEVTETSLGLPIYSDTLLSSAALKVINRLVVNGLAEKISKSGSTRFRSVSVSADK